MSTTCPPVRQPRGVSPATLSAEAFLTPEERFREVTPILAPGLRASTAIHGLRSPR